METITIPLDLLDETMSKLGALPTKDGFGVIYEKLRYEKIKFVMAENSAKEAAKTKKNQPTQLTELTKKLRESTKKVSDASKKTDADAKLKPLAMAREYLAKNPDAKPEDIQKYLCEKHVKPITANTTSYKVFKKN